MISHLFGELPKINFLSGEKLLFLSILTFLLGSRGSKFYTERPKWCFLVSTVQIELIPEYNDIFHSRMSVNMKKNPSHSFNFDAISSRLSFFVKTF